MTATAIYLGIVVAHSISFATELYTIAKLPLIVLGFALLVRRLEDMPGYAFRRAPRVRHGRLGLLIWRWRREPMKTAAAKACEALLGSNEGR